MSKEPLQNNAQKKIQETEEKILYGAKNKHCFACGHIIEKRAKECSYCGTKQQ